LGIRTLVCGGDIDLSFGLLMLRIRRAFLTYLKVRALSCALVTSSDRCGTATDEELL